MNEIKRYAYPGADEFEEKIDMQFSTTEGEDKELSEAALNELSDNKGDD